MLKIQIMSDLHLEFDDKLRGKQVMFDKNDVFFRLNTDDYQGFMPAKTGADVLILAGDIHLDTQAKQWLLERLTEYKHVIYLAGNHEYYHGNFDEVNTELRHMATVLNEVGGGNFYFLNNDVVEIENVKFMGTTMWTNFFNHDPHAMFTVGRGLNDYHIIRKTYISTKTGKKKTRNLSPSDTYIENSVARIFLEEELAKDTDKVKFVITHHGPSRKSIYKYYENSDLNAGYVSDFDTLVNQSDYWVHGHTHKSFDYKIGNGRVICNPRGYFPYKDLNENFRDDLVVEV